MMVRLGSPTAYGHDQIDKAQQLRHISWSTAMTLMEISRTGKNTAGVWMPLRTRVVGRGNGVDESTPV